MVSIVSNLPRPLCQARRSNTHGSKDQPRGDEVEMSNRVNVGGEQPTRLMPSNCPAYLIGAMPLRHGWRGSSIRVGTRTESSAWNNGFTDFYAYVCFVSIQSGNEPSRSVRQWVSVYSLATNCPEASVEFRLYTAWCRAFRSICRIKNIKKNLNQLHWSGSLYTCGWS